MLSYDYVLLLALCTTCLIFHGSLGEERCFFDGKEVPQNTDLTDLPKRPLHWHRLACLTLNPRTLTLVKPTQSLSCCMTYCTTQYPKDADGVEFINSDSDDQEGMCRCFKCPAPNTGRPLKIEKAKSVLMIDHMYLFNDKFRCPTSGLKEEVKKADCAGHLGQKCTFMCKDDAYEFPNEKAKCRAEFSEDGTEVQFKWHPEPYCEPKIWSKQWKNL